MRSDDLDLRELLDFQPRGGVIRLMGQRAVLFDTVALGLLRKELVDTVGLFAARGILTRFGFAHGWRTGEALKREHPDLWAEGKAGPHLPPLWGQFILGKNVRTDGLGEAPLVETTWHHSYEAEQHLLMVGRADDAVCWTTCGFASGYVSYKEGREVYFVEDRCAGKGDPGCHVTARFRERWGEDDLERILPYYRAESIDLALQEVTAKLKRAERKLKARRDELGMLGRDDVVDASGTVTRSEPMRRLLERARVVAKTDSSVVVSGESGVGKERVARLLHGDSARSAKPFVAVNCGAIPDSLLERELFGHAKGAYTGADAEGIGLFEAANGGTLFLDEIGEVPPPMQVKLLRTLQEREIRRVGETRTRPVDVRIVAATNRDLAAEVAAGRFRRDLFYRLRVIELRIPPLRERTEDVLPLARFFLAGLARSMKRPVTGISAQAAELLKRHPWPGNVRELQNAIEYAVALCGGAQVRPEDLPEELRQAAPPASARGVRPLDAVEREAILGAMRATKGNKAECAEALGIGLATLYRKLKVYGEA